MASSSTPVSLEEDTDSFSWLSRELLAKLLAVENILVRYDGSASTASFDVEKRTLTLPLFSYDDPVIFIGFSGHEVGHAIFTPESKLDAAKKITDNPAHWAIAGDYVNVCEDTRIEKLIKEKYYGFRRVFSKAYSLLYSRGMFGNVHAKNIQTYSLIDRLNIDAKLGHIIIVPFSVEEKPYISAVYAARTWDELIAACRALFEFSLDQLKQQQQQQQQQQPESASDDSSQQQETSSDFGDESESSSSPDQPSRNRNSSTDKEQTKSVVGSSPESKDEKISENELNSLGSKTQKQFDDQQQGEIDSVRNSPAKNLDTVKSLTVPGVIRNNMLISQDTVDKVLLQKRTIDQGKSLYTDYLRQVQDDILFMCQQFQTLRNARNYAKVQRAQLGEIDTRILYAYRTESDIFLEEDIEPEQQNHGLLILVDWSTSMTPTLGYVFRKLVSVVMFCLRSSIPFRVYAFSEKNSAHVFADQDSKFRLGSHPLFLLLSSEMSRVKIDQVFASLFGRLDVTGSYKSASQNGVMQLVANTPLGESFIILSEVYETWKKQDHIDKLHTLVLTDDQANSFFAELVFDPKTRIHYSNRNSDDPHSAIKRMYSDRTKSKITAFHIDKAQRMKSMANYQEYSDEIQKNGFAIVPKNNRGYDTFVLMDANRINDAAAKKQRRMVLGRFIQDMA